MALPGQGDNPPLCVKVSTAGHLICLVSESVCAQASASALLLPTRHAAITVLLYLTLNPDTWSTVGAELASGAAVGIPAGNSRCAGYSDVVHR